VLSLSASKTTNHDVKAVEYFIKAKFTEFGWEKQKEWIHFALTSQDINNTAIPLSIKDGVEQVYLPALKCVPSFSFSCLVSSS
jgi:adenylosuccinate lyase